MERFSCLHEDFLWTLPHVVSRIFLQCRTNSNVNTLRVFEDYREYGRMHVKQTFLTEISLQIDTNEYLCIALASVALTLFVEMPFNNLKSLLFDGKKHEPIDKQHCDVKSNIREKHL